MLRPGVSAVNNHQDQNQLIEVDSDPDDRLASRLSCSLSNAFYNETEVSGLFIAACFVALFSAPFVGEGRRFNRFANSYGFIHYETSFCLHAKFSYSHFYRHLHVLNKQTDQTTVCLVFLFGATS